MYENSLFTLTIILFTIILYRIIKNEITIIKDSKDIDEQFNRLIKKDS